MLSIKPTRIVFIVLAHWNNISQVDSFFFHSSNLSWLNLCFYYLN